MPEPLPPPVTPEPKPTSWLTAAEPQLPPPPPLLVVGTVPEEVVVTGGTVVLVVSVVGAAPCQWQEHSLDISFGLFLQLEAHEGRPVVAV